MIYIICFSENNKRRKFVNAILTEEKIEKRIDNIDATRYNTLKRLCQQVADFINMECTPHTTITISTNDFVVKEDITNGWLKEKE